MQQDQSDTETITGAVKQYEYATGLYGRTIEAIGVSGLKRIERDAILAKITSEVGQKLTAEKVRADIRAIYNLGYFDDVSVDAEPVGAASVRVTYSVKERPVISNVDFEGNERIGTSDLKEVIKTKQWSILDINKVKEDVAKIQKHYEDKGFYLAKVSFEVRPTKDEQVELIFKVNDFEKVQIKKIIFLNNNKFTDEQLKGALGETREGNALSFLTGSGNFKESAFKFDLQRLLYFYLDHGYVKFRHENPIVTVSDDKKWLFISLYVEEGDQYHMGTTDFSGDLLFSKEELYKEVSLSAGDVFSISKRNQDIQKLTEKYQDLGYAFVNVVPKVNIHEDTRTIDVDYAFEKGNLVHFGEINVIGNTKTHDKVIRRELKIKEGELFNGTKLRVSRENVERLGYFAPGEVIFNTVAPPGRPDILNVEIRVKERSTGTITLGAGYGSIQKFFVTGQISEINLFGRGQTLSLSGQYSIASAQYPSSNLNLGFVNPYTLDTLWTTAFDVYLNRTPIPYRWTSFRRGFDVRFGYPVFEYASAFVSYKLERNDDQAKQDPSIPDQILQQDSGLLSSVTTSFIRDKRNNRFETTSGNYQLASLETAGAGGDFKFFKWMLNNRFYVKVVGDLVFKNSVEVGQITTYGGVPMPPSQKFYLGGPNNLRGYQTFLLGPQGPITAQGNPQPLGGNFEAFALFELEFPLVKEAGIKGVVFFDSGNAWEHVPSGGPDDPFVIRTDVGFGFRWFSPIGPLRFEWAFPLAKKPGESMQFVFFIGPPF